MSNGWIVPRDKQSILWRRAGATTYREGAAPLVEVGPVPMPPRAVHWLDLEADTLIYAHQGELTVVRGILQGKPVSSTVTAPGGSTLHALTVIDDVVYAGADAGPGMLGWVDLRAPLRWQPIEVPANVRVARKGVDGFARHGDRLVAIDDMIIPRYLLLLDIADPRAPRLTDSRVLPPHSTAEGITSITSSGDTVVMLSISGNRGTFVSHVAFMDLPTLEEWAVLQVQPPSSARQWADRPHDFRAVALHGDRLLIAAGADGIGLMRVPPRPAGLQASPPPDLFATSSAPQIPVTSVRFVPVPAGPVLDVVPVDDARAFAVFEEKVGFFKKRSRIDAALISLTS